MNRDKPKRARSQSTVDRASYKGALVVGPSSIFAAWVHNLLRDAAAAMTLQLRFLDKFDDVGPEEEWSQTLYLTQFPSAPVISIIEGGRMPVLALLDEAQDAVAYIRRSSGCTFIEALRVATSGAVADRALLHADSALVLHRNYRGSTSGLIDKMLDHLVMRIPAEAYKAIKQKYLGSALEELTLENSLQRAPFYKPPGEWSNELTAAEAAIVDEVLKPMVLMALQENCVPIRWSYRVLLSGDRPNEPAPMIAEVAGAARNIYYGPYFYLPPGTYRARLVAGFSKEAVGLPFSADVAGSTQLAKARFRPAEPGILEGEFLVVHNLPQDSLEMRFRNDEGEIDGQVGVAWIEFEFLGDEALPIHSVT